MAHEITVTQNTSSQDVRKSLHAKIRALEKRVQAYQSSFQTAVKTIEDAIQKEPTNTTYPKILETLQQEFAKNMERSHGNMLTMQSQLRNIENLQPQSSHTTQLKPNS